MTTTDHSAIFDGVPIARFCRNGVTALRFRGTSLAGESVGGTVPRRIEIQIQIQKKD